MLEIMLAISANKLSIWTGALKGRILLHFKIIVYINMPFQRLTCTRFNGMTNRATFILLTVFKLKLNASQ